MTQATLAEHFAAVESRIAQACHRAERERRDVTLIAVSKRHPANTIREAWTLGHRHFGENYAQELRDKHRQLADCPGLRWHAIGPVQPKNAKYIAQAAHVFHALDSLEVAHELSRRRQGTPLSCLVEINIAQEDSKAGLLPHELGDFLKAVHPLPQLEVVGLTAMPPATDSPEQSRPHFFALRKLALACDLRMLSMGTTADFEVAIEEGAHWIRVGTALFGERPAKAP